MTTWLVVIGTQGELVTHHPNGISKSAFPKEVKAALDGGTARNVRTLRKLLDICEP
ncbi:MAG: hypothetical protein ACR2H3_13780 [Acidimicrobiales bacterium]